MSREDGFSRADVDSTMLDDLKFRRLWTRLGHQGLMAEATTVYLSTLLRSWHDGLPVNAEDAAPPWLSPSDDTLNALVSVGLLDKDHRIPKRSFDAWFRPAWERRERLRSGGRMTAERRWGDQSVRQTDRQTVIATSPANSPATSSATSSATPLRSIDDPSDAKLVDDLRRFASSEDALVAENARGRLQKMGLA